MEEVQQVAINIILVDRFLYDLKEMALQICMYKIRVWSLEEVKEHPILLYTACQVLEFRGQLT